MRELARHLTAFQLTSRLYQVAFGDIQRQIMLSAPAPLRVVLYRRLMVRIAERLARRTRAAALVTGESVGQVASQTLENLAVIDAAVASLPILRPLVGSDKDEISDQAQAIGTYPISIIPDQDCCQLFTPRHPATRAARADVEAAERALPLQELVDGAVAAVEREDFSFPPKADAPAERRGDQAGVRRFRMRRRRRRRRFEVVAQGVARAPEGELRPGQVVCAEPCRLPATRRRRAACRRRPSRRRR